MCTTPAADDEKKHLLLTARWNGLAITAHDAILSKHLHFPQLERLSGNAGGLEHSRVNAHPPIGLARGAHIICTAVRWLSA